MSQDTHNPLVETCEQQAARIADLERQLREVIPESGERMCPDCGRPKALSLYQVMSGACPKWWAIRDPDAANDCLRNKLAKCGHISYRGHDDMCVEAECPSAAYQAPPSPPPASAIDAAAEEICFATHDAPITGLHFSVIAAILRKHFAEPAGQVVRESEVRE